VKIYYDEVPDNITIIEYIKSKTHWNEAVNDVGGVSKEILYSPVLNIDNSKHVLNDVYELYRNTGAISWQSQDSCELYGLSLSYNPNSHEFDWKRGCFGHKRYQDFTKYDYFTAVKKDLLNKKKNDYLDFLCFRKFLPHINEVTHSLRKLLDIFPSSVHKITSRTINGNMIYPSTISIDGGMHLDDNQFESMRFNLCLSNNEYFGLQYIDHEPYFPKAGDLNFINTDVKHRAFTKATCDFQRTHLVINVSPWLDYHPEEDYWELNKYFGKVHPIDMIKNGLLFNKEKL
jgi:hypothetical protein